VNNRVQGIALFFFEWYHSPLVDDTPHVLHVLGIEVIRLQANRSLPAEVALYLDSKRGEDLAANTLYKHKLTLSRLETFCDAEGL
jgi:hypothetical protein